MMICLFKIGKSPKTDKKKTPIASTKTHGSQIIKIVAQVKCDSALKYSAKSNSVTKCSYYSAYRRWKQVTIIQSAAERTPLFEKRINSKPKKIRQMFFYFWKEHRMPFYINVFWTKHHSSGGLEYWYTDVASLRGCPWPWESFQV